MRIRTAAMFCVFVTALSVTCLPATAQQSIDESLASQYFQQAESICAKDNSTLWGIKLCGPMLLVDPSTRSIVANQIDREGNLTKKGNVFVGKLPDKINIANTAMTCRAPLAPRRSAAPMSTTTSPARKQKTMAPE